jgi:hypothetical protein
VADHRCNLMGTEFVPEAKVISHNKINLCGLMTLIKREELNWKLLNLFLRYLVNTSRYTINKIYKGKTPRN